MGALVIMLVGAGRRGGLGARRLYFFLFSWV